MFHLYLSHGVSLLVSRRFRRMTLRRRRRKPKSETISSSILNAMNHGSNVAWMMEVVSLTESLLYTPLRTTQLWRGITTTVVWIDEDGNSRMSVEGKRERARIKSNCVIRVATGEKETVSPKTTAWWSKMSFGYWKE